MGMPTAQSLAREDHGASREPTQHDDYDEASLYLPDNLESFVRSNTPSVISDSSSIEDSPCVVRQQIDEALARVEGAAATLKRQRNEIQKRILANLLQQFTNEVLVNIFRFAVEMEPLHTAFSLSWTCAKWRKVVVARPDMWTRITIFPTTKEKIVELQLRRSEDLPLDITIDCPVDRGSGALEAVYDQSARWSKANIAIPYSSVGLMDAYIQGNTILLQELELDFYDDNGKWAADPPSCLAFSDALNLRILKFRRSLPKDRVSLPWWQLDVVEFTESYAEPELFSMEELVVVFMPTTFRVNCSPRGDYFLTESRTFGHLSTLTMTVWNSSLGSQLQSIKLPDVRTLEFDFGDQLNESLSDEFALALDVLLERSGVNEKLRRLKLAGNFSERAVMSTLHCCPRLEELVLQETFSGSRMITADVMELLALPYGILPWLKRIELVWSPHSVSGQMIAVMIHSRMIRYDLEYEGGQSCILEDIGLGVRGGESLTNTLRATPASSRTCRASVFG
ncbi:hypothetical protein BDZ89DRAFT_1157372 [Hymenopellis radicata]|nr:hypothetical protein BDZ89DRAFT_1157372 [Hymenopellis radicata]